MTQYSVVEYFNLLQTTLCIWYHFFIISNLDNMLVVVVVVVVNE